MSMQVRGVDVARYFGPAGKAKRRLNWWKSLPGREYVADKVLAHISAKIYDVEPQHILSLDTEHPLGDLREDFHNTAKLVRDWRPDFAFTHLFHFCLEDLGRIYSWQEFRDEWSAAPDRRPWLWEPARMMQEKAADHLVRTKKKYVSRRCPCFCSKRHAVADRRVLLFISSRNIRSRLATPARLALP